MSVVERDATPMLTVRRSPCQHRASRTAAAIRSAAVRAAAESDSSMTNRNSSPPQQSYDLGANCFLTKPVDLDQFLKVVQAVEDFWLGVVRLPGRPRPASLR